MGALFALAACAIGARFFRAQAAAASADPHAAAGDGTLARPDGLERH